MSERWWTFLVAAAIFAATATPALYLQDEHVYRTKVIQAQYRDSLYLPNSKYVKAVTCGYDQFAAHFLWLRMIQSFAAGWTTSENVNQMMQYFEVISDLDPHFVETYSLAMMAVTDKAKRFDYMDRIVEKEFQNNPGEYRIPYEAAYNAYWEDNNPELAKYYTRLALFDPAAPIYVQRYIPFFDMKEGRFRAAYDYSLRHYLDAIIASSGTEASNQIDEHNISLFRLNLFRAADGWIRSVIEPVAIKYHNEHGAWPKIEDLDQAGAFAGVDLPDFGMVFGVTENIRAGNMKMNPGDVDKFIQISVKKWDRLPPSPYSFLKQSMPGYVVWPDSTILRSTSKKVESKSKLEMFELIVSRGEAMIELRRILGFIETQAMEYKAEHQGRAPEKFEDFAPQFVTQHDPFGGNYQWDPKTEKASCTGLPGFTQNAAPIVMW